MDMLRGKNKGLKLAFPGGSVAALSIFDDADHGNKENLEPIYDKLYEYGVITTRSTWILPSKRGGNTESLFDKIYVEWLKKIKTQGFEIALHNVGNGIYTKDEIRAGLELFKDNFDEYPKIHTNHHSNPDNVYWGTSDRFSWPINWLYHIIGKDKRKRYLGSTPNSPCFWADILSTKIKYVRNLVFNHINTLKMDPYMPYWNPKCPLVPFWFSSTDMRNVNYFSQILSEKNLDILCEERGVCIGYTHFGSPGFIEKNGNLSESFVKSVDNVKNRNIWVAPVSEILDYLLQRNGYYDCELTLLKSFVLSMRWAFNRILNKAIVQ